ncbi:hypothetical protein Bca4012_095325 [Brassica carinata]
MVVLVFERIPCYRSDRGRAGIGRRRTDLWNPGELCEEEPSRGVGDSDAKEEGWVIGSEEHQSWGDSDVSITFNRDGSSMAQSKAVEEWCFTLDKQSCVNNGKVYPGEAALRFSETERDKYRYKASSGSVCFVFLFSVLDRGFAKTSIRLSLGFFGSSTGFLMPMVTGPGIDLLIPSKTTKP